MDSHTNFGPFHSLFQNQSKPLEFINRTGFQLQDACLKTQNQSQAELYEPEDLYSSEISDYNTSWIQASNLYTIDDPLQSYNSMPALTFNSEEIYTKYEDLPEFAQGTDLKQVVNQLQILFQDKTNWKNTFDAIDNIRILNKYLTRELNNIVINFWPYIIESLQNPKVFVVRNSMYLVTEIFMNSRCVSLLDEIITNLVPLVLLKVSYEKGALKEQAQEALKELCASCCFDSTVMIICTEAHSQDKLIAQSATKALVQLINNIGRNISKLKYESLRYLMKTLASSLEIGELESMRKLAGMTCVFISKRYGLQNFEDLLKNSDLTPTELTEVVKIVKSDKSFDAIKKKIEDPVNQGPQQQIFNLEASLNLNTMTNPDGVFANLIPLAKDPGTTNGLFSKVIPEEKFVLQSNIGFGAMMMTENGLWNGFENNNSNKF